MKIKELLNDALPLISNYAPTIASVITGHVGIAAGFIISILANAFSVHPNGIAGLSAQINNDPENQEKLEKLEQEFGSFLHDLIATSNNSLSKAEINVKLEWQTDQK
jgi:hypothetical protein